MSDKLQNITGDTNMSDYELQGFGESDLEYHKRLARVEDARAAFFLQQSVMLWVTDAQRAVFVDHQRQALERAAFHRAAIGLHKNGGTGK